jgi:hypothetical protein
MGSKVFVFSGGGFKSNLASCEMLDTNSNKWTNIASMPSDTLRHALSVIKFNHFIYCIGGWENGSIASKVVERYDTMKD